MEIVEKFIIGPFGKFFRRFLKDIISIELRIVFFLFFASKTFLEDLRSQISCRVFKQFTLGDT